MIGQELKIIFSEDKIHLSPEKSIHLSQDQIISFQHIAFNHYGYSFNQATFSIKVLNYKPDQNKILAKVISFTPAKLKFPQNQIKLFDLLNKIEKIDFEGFTKHLSDEELITNERKVVSESSLFPTVGGRVVISETFSVLFKEIKFKLGGVSFFKKFKELRKPIELTILNYDIREEFDAVKNYFANALNTKRIEVTVKIEVIDGSIISSNIKSPEIDRINKDLIENVKFQFVRETIKKHIKAEIDKNLFTMDEFFDSVSDEKLNPNTFYKNEKELFEGIVQIHKTKHYKHLRFLSDKHLHDKMRLRFVNKPFSFIFLLEGERNYHIIWETLDTKEATYIWHIEKNSQNIKQVLKYNLEKIEDIINVIKVQGKTVYINSNEDQFRRIKHDYSELVDGFVKWKGDLESILT